jgi:oligopeptide/dipeptide ABC transporter ATP-binding protein
MFQGRIVEIGPSEQIYHDPRHPYTTALLGAVLSIDPRRRRLGDMPAAERTADVTTTGCPYAPRCPQAVDRCRTEAPGPTEVDEALVWCHLAGGSEPGAHAAAGEAGDTEIETETETDVPEEPAVTAAEDRR